MSDRSKLERLEKTLLDMESALVAYSGGVDSTFLLKVAADTLGDRVVTVTASSAIRPGREVAEAEELAAALGVRHIVMATDELDDENFATNPPERCYHCKRSLLSKLLELAREHGLRWVAEGSIENDTGDYRPGMAAVSELGVRSPLREVGLTKAEVRELSRELGLPTWEKPSSPCLATRIPYGTRITTEALSRVERAEELLAGLGLRVSRVRVHGDTARIEVPRADEHVVLAGGNRESIVRGLKAIGFRYVSLDLEGYRTGSMNEPLGEKGQT